MARIESRNKIAVIGSSGYLGKNLIEYFYKCGYIIGEFCRNPKENKFKLDLLDFSDFDENCFKHYEYVIFAAGISNPEMCKKYYDEAHQINVVGTKRIIKNALNKNCKVIFLSSDAVFGNDKKHVFLDNTITKPDTVYGKMKKEVEDFFENNDQFISLRLSYVIGKKDKFNKYLKKCSEEGIVAEIYHPYYRNCIFLNELLQSINWIITNWGKLKSNLINICGREMISKIQIVDEFNRYAKDEVLYVFENDDDFFINRPRIVNMNGVYMKLMIDNYEYSFSERYKIEMNCVNGGKI
jgi:dTDP-4-dehydrorhamnose reductase